MTGLEFAAIAALCAATAAREVALPLWPKKPKPKPDWRSESLLTHAPPKRKMEGKEGSAGSRPDGPEPERRGKGGS